MNITEENLKKYIRDIPDFPEKGIVFKDITTLLKDKEALKAAVDVMVEKYKDQGIEQVVGVESRGFIFGSILAYKLGAGFVPVRKKGKLPSDIHSVTYDLEYGTDTVEIHTDAIGDDMCVLVVDDLLATGGTVRAVCDLLKKQKANVVGLSFLIELEFLKGNEKLKEYDIYSLIKY